MRKNPNTTETVDGWYPVILSDGTRGYISSQFVVWEKPYDPPKKTTTTKTYIYVNKSGYPKSGWAGNRLKQTQRLNLKSSPKSSSNTVRSVPYATEGVVRGRTSNGYYVSGGNGYQIVYGIESHIIFSKPTKNTTLLLSNDALIVKTSNQKSSTGCCGSGSSKDDIPDKIPNGTTTKTEDSVDVEVKYYRVTSFNGVNIREKPDVNSKRVGGASYNEKLQLIDSKHSPWLYIETSSGTKGYVHSDNLSEKEHPYSDVDFNLGSLSSKYESNGDPGAISTGENDAGDVSFGAYQFSTKTNGMDDFMTWLKSNQGKDDFYGMVWKTLNAAYKKDGGYGETFKSSWKDIADKYGEEFYAMQHECVKAKWYNLAVKEIKSSTGYDVSTKSIAMKNVLWSTAVQHGVSGCTTIFTRAINNKKDNLNNEKGLIEEIYRQRKIYYPNDSNRYNEELDNIEKMLS